MLSIGGIIAERYQVLELVLNSGHNSIYRAKDLKTEKIWQLREMRYYEENGKVIKKLPSELLLLYTLDHQNLQKIPVLCLESSRCIAVMEPLIGDDLLSLREKGRKENPNSKGAQDPLLVIRWAKQLCNLFIYLHSQHPEIACRYMDPSHIILQEDGNLKTFDSGLISISEDGERRFPFLIGRGYAAPELFVGGTVNERTDIHLLGATLYHLITGLSPKETDFSYSKHPISRYVPQLKNSEIEKVIQKCIQVDPDDRYRNCMELMQDLDRRPI